MPYCQLFYHLVWATRGRLPLLTPEVEPRIYKLLVGKALGLGAAVFALNGVEDHVHMVVSVPPKLAVATFVGQVKGVTSARFNQASETGPEFYWQEEYGAFTFDLKRMPSYVAYVRQQKQHHQGGTVIPILERVEAVDAAVSHEPASVYELEDAAWRDELLSFDGS